MANKTLERGKKSLLIIFAIFLGISAFLSGCSSKVEENPDAQRIIDSASVYSALNSAYKNYQEALKSFQEDKKSSSQKSYEKSVSVIYDVDMKIFDNPRNVQWKSDYNELGKSIVQDYLASQLDIDEKSNVFKLATRFNIKYEKVNVFTNVDVEPLPNGSDLPLIRNNLVDEYIDFFSKTDRGRGFIDKTLYRSGKYFPLMRKIIRFHNAPEEIIYLSVQESGLSPTIISKAGAVGLWQFMPSTGSSYGLYQDSYRDDRRDFEKSTDAAARHLKDLFRSFNDWYLAFASYNAGPGRITSAMSKSGSKDFWDIRGYLPGETKNYVPSILAISYIFRDPESYGFKNVEYAKPLSFDRLNIKANLTFDQLADFAETDVETIRDLNPELLQDALPQYDVPYQLRIPQGSHDKFVSNFKKSSEFERNGMFIPEFAGNEEALYGDEPVGSYFKVDGYNPGDDKYVVSTQNKKKITYTFKNNDNLKSIADSFKVRASDIRIWNSIPVGTYPKSNQGLNIYLSQSAYNKLYGIVEPKPDSSNSEIKKPDTTSYRDEKTEKKKKENNKQPEIKKEEKKETTKKNIPINKKEQSYTVKEGDSIGLLAELYGVTIQDIIDWNNLKDDKILVGQKLKVYSNKKIETSEKKTKTTKHIVAEGEYLSTIAGMYDVTVDDLKEWNELERDKILVGQELIVVQPQKKDVKEKTTNKNSKSKTHKVTEGENLSGIADNYGVTIDDIMDWNNLENDKILVGQVLVVSDPGKKTSKDETTKEKTSTKNSKSKTHKVIEGENLTGIADKYGVTVDDLLDWNDLENDKILVGQVLTVSDSKTKTSKEKTTGKTKKITYKVKKGDKLRKIADEYDVTIENLMEWNSLKRDKITVGQELKIFIKDTGKKK